MKVLSILQPCNKISIIITNHFKIKLFPIITHEKTIIRFIN